MDEKWLEELARGIVESTMNATLTQLAETFEAAALERDGGLEATITYREVIAAVRAGITS